MAQQILIKLPGIKFYEYLFNGSRIVLYGRTDMANLIGAFLIFRYKGAKKVKMRQGL
jgi:hypothetical protein